MNKDSKSHLMNAVMHSTFTDVKRTFNKYKLIKDESLFDYDLLNAALKRKNTDIVNFLLKQGCRLRNQKEISSEEMLLNLAMKLDNASIIKHIIKNGTSIYDKYLNGESLFYAAFKEGHYNAVDGVLKNSNFNNINPSNKNDLLNFHIAFVRNDRSIIEHFLQQGFDVNHPLSLDSTEYSGLNPLHYAAAKKDFNMFKKLLSYGGDLSIKNGDEQTPLHIIFYSYFLENGSCMILKTFDHGNETKYINCVDRNGVSHFHLACVSNSPIHVQKFIDRGVNVSSAISLSSPIHPGFTPLHTAVMNAREDLVELLLKYDADCNKADKDGVTPLHLACQLSVFNDIDESIIKMLLQNKACPTAVDEEGHTPLHVAFYHLNCEKSQIFGMLMSKISSEVNFIDDQGLSHFHIACARNYINHVNDYLTSGVNINNPVFLGEYSGYTALHFAALYNQKDAVEMLLKRNAQVNIKTSTLEVTPLHLACNNMNMNDSADKRQLDIINLLLLHGANIDSRNSLGQTALLYACSIDHYDIDRVKAIIEILLSNNAKINVCTNEQETILHIICKNCHLNNSKELTEFLISKGADVHAADFTGLTPLHVATKYSKLELVEIFLKYKANVNAKSKDLKIPLQLTYDKDILLVLVENGSDVNIFCDNGQTLLQNNISNAFIFKKLLNYGADINMENPSGQSSVCSLFDKIKNAEERRQKQNRIRTICGPFILRFPFDMHYVEVIKIIFIHVQKLQALGLQVSEKVKTCCDELCRKIELNADLMNLMYDKCTEELNRMKFIKIDQYTSLYNILLKDPHALSRHVINNSLIKILEDQCINDNFPLYSYLLKLQFKKGLMRRNLLKDGKSSLNYISSFSLPDPCYDSLLKYLTNEDITILKEAVLPVINHFKRKIDNNFTDSTEMEPPAKLQKKE